MTPRRAPRTLSPRLTRWLARPCSLAVTLAFVLAATSGARADEAEARQHFKRGVELYDKKRYEPALESFRAAYGSLPSAGIKRNIALCLERLGRPVEAATTFDEALDEDGGTLEPEVRAAMEQEVAALSTIVATVRLKVVAAADKRALDDVVVTVDDRPLTPAARRRPVRLEPGIHVFTAHADGVPDPPEKRLSLLAGSPVDATFELGPPLSVLKIVPSVPDAVVQIDGAEVGRGVWSGRVPAGAHRVIVSAPGFKTTTAVVDVSPGASLELPVVLLAPAAPPPVYVPRARKPAERKPRYLVPTLAYEAQSLRVGPALGEPAGGTTRQFEGGAVGMRAGYRLSRALSVEILGDVGQVASTYTIGSSSAESKTKVAHWQLMPAVRFATAGAIRFTAASGVGVHGLIVDGEIRAAPAASDVATASSGATKRTGSGVGASWLVDMGAQVDVGSLFLEASVFFVMHGVGATRDDATAERELYSSPATRAGLRAGLGIPF